MRQIAFIFTMVLSATASFCQTQHWDENTGRNVGSEVNRFNLFSNVEMDLTGRLITFSHVPEMSQEIKVVITDADGNEVIQKAITPLNNTVSLHGLHKGKMYFATIIYNDKTQKAFTLHLS